MKKITAFILAFILVLPTFCVEANTVENFVADVEEIPFECGTDENLSQELYNSLFQKKFPKLINTNNHCEEGISLFQTSFRQEAILMPSTGDVKALVVPIEFKDEKFQDRNFSQTLTDRYFAKQESGYESLSFCDYFKKVSQNKLRLSGVVLPIYTANNEREYYENYGKWLEEIVTAINLKKDIIGDLSEYDSNNDGYIDCLHVIWAGPTGGWASEWWSQIASGRKVELYDGKIIGSYAYIAGEQSSVRTLVHETGHLLGLPDNYANSPFSCVIPTGCDELMETGYQINALYRYLLGWEEPVILPYEDSLQTIELYPSDYYSYSENTVDEVRSVMLMPDSSVLPFAEFYMIEFRAVQRKNYEYRYKPGIIIWHINLKEDYDHTVALTDDYIKPVFRSNDTRDFEEGDFYYEGDIWSDTTVPSSKLHEEAYTGAYMKVLGMDSESAIIRAGFVEPDLGSVPTIDVSPPAKTAVKSGEKRLEYTVSYDNADIVGIFNELIVSGMNLSGYSIMDYIQIDSTGTATAQYGTKIMSNGTIFPVYVDNIKGEGTLTVRLKARSAYKTGALGGRIYAPAVTLGTIYVDNTPPEIVLNGESEITLQYGESYVEQGAQITDNFDPDIESKLVIEGFVDTRKPGTYSVCYNATDHAGNKANQVERIVTVLAPIAGQVQYSTTNPTNQTVTATYLTAGEESEDKILSHTFTENGAFTFEFTDDDGNNGTAIASVDWIDRTPPTAEVTYSITEQTNQDVVVTLTPSEEVTQDTELSYTFTENGEHTFILTDLAGNTTEIPVQVDWIYKPPLTAEIQYSTTQLTNQDVEVTLIPSREVTADTVLTHTFKKNGTYTFILTDLAGETAEIPVTVDWIDKTRPKSIVQYSTTEPARRYVTVTLEPSEEVTEDTILSHTFAENGTHTFTLTDLAGNTSQRTVEVDWIIGIPVEIEYSTTELTNQDVTVTLTPLEPVTEDTVLTHTFTENGKYTFILREPDGYVTKKEIEVTWIDKDPPVVEARFAPSTPTNKDVKVAVVNRELMKVTTYTVTENGTYVYTESDLAGNTATITVVIDWIDKTPPTAEVQYSTKHLTNQDVVVTLIPSEEVTADTELTHTFTENGTYTFTLTDLVGNTSQKTVEVTWIDKTLSLTAEVEYSTEQLTNQDVVVTLVPTAAVTADTELTYTFTENGEHTFILTDLAGNKVEIPVAVDWIDKTPPTAKIEYSTTELTNQDVVVTLTPSETVTEDTKLTYTFTENGEHTFILTDLAGNTSEISVVVDWIDKTAPTAEVQYSTTELTNQDVVVTLVPAETVTEDTELTYTFTENSEHTFVLTDLAGNKVEIPVAVDWIDKTPPTAEVQYSTTELTNQDVVVTLTPSETVTEDTELTYTFTENGEHTFVLTDLAGNTAEITVAVDWIEKAPSIFIPEPKNKKVVYDGNPQEYPTPAVSSGKEVTVQYKTKDSDEDWTDTAPTNVGTYLVKISAAGEDESEKIVELSITPAIPTGNVTASDITTRQYLSDSKLHHTFVDLSGNLLTGALEWDNPQADGKAPETIVPRAEAEYAWTFTPEDKNYKAVKGKATIAVEAVPIEVSAVIVNLPNADGTKDYAYVTVDDTLRVGDVITFYQDTDCTNKIETITIDADIKAGIKPAIIILHQATALSKAGGTVYVKVDGAVNVTTIDYKAEADFKLSAESVSLKKGQSETITVVPTADYERCEWEIADKTVAAIANIQDTSTEVIGLKAGSTTTLTVTVYFTHPDPAKATERIAVSKKVNATVAAASKPVGGGGVSGGGVTPTLYTVTYEAGTLGTINGANTEKISTGKTPSNIPAVEGKEGYEFVGWSLTKDGEVINVSEQQIRSNVTFYAVYKEVIPVENKHTAYMQGYEDGTFKPNRSITRAEVAVLITKLDAVNLEQSDPADFADVAPDSWYAPYIGYAQKSGIMKGDEAGTFRPDAPITRAEFAVIAARYAKLENRQESSKFSDIADTFWAARNIYAVVHEGWMQGYPDGTFEPLKEITRAEVVQVVNGMLDRRIDGSNIADASYKTFSDVPESHWAYYQIIEATNDHMYTKEKDKEIWLKE